VLVAAQFMRAPAEGWRPAGWVPKAAGASGVTQSQVSRTPWEMLRTPTFWVLYVMMTMVAFGGLMVTAQLKPIAASYGMDKSVLWFGISALAFALMLDRIVNGITRPFWGWVSDHIGRYNTMAITFFLEAIALLLLLQLIDRPVWFVVLSGFVFFAWGNIYSLFPAAIGDLFGPKYATTNYGIQYTAKGAAAIFAGVGTAWLVQVTGSWTPVFWVAIACDLAAAVLAYFWLKPLALRMTQPSTVAKPTGVGVAVS
jgi:OFA family oxalate/formate antiporter-like MFS transporter